MVQGCWKALYHSSICLSLRFKCWSSHNEQQGNWAGGDSVAHNAHERKSQHYTKQWNNTDKANSQNMLS